MSSPYSTARPSSVTMVVVLTWLAAAMAIVSGVVVLFLSDAALEEAGISPTTANISAWTEIVIGVIIALVAVGVSNGSNLARMLISILMVVRAAFGIWAIVMFPNGLVTGLVTIVLAVLVLYLLWNAKANAFFETN
jgi:hypothetical protein